MRPKIGPNVVVFFDANMPDVRACHHGCTSDASHFCKHRFGPRVWLLCNAGRLIFTQQTDIQVVLDFLYIINHRIKRYQGSRRYVIVTHDQNFLTAAQLEHKSPPFNQHPRLAWGNKWVQFVGGNGPVRIEIRCIPHSNRNKDLAAAVGIVRELRASH